MTSKPRKRLKLQYPQLVVAGLLAWLLSLDTSAGGTLQPFDDEGATGDFSLVDLKDNTHTLADYQGKIVLVNFWASWCPPCIKEMPMLERLQQALNERPFKILTVNVGEQKYRVWKFVKLVNFELPVLLDSHKDTFDSWGASVLPTSFLLDRKGNIRYRVQGDIEWDDEDVTTLIETLINEEENE